MTVGNKIRNLRRERKLTQEQLAEYMTVSPQAVSKWETGASTPDVDMLPRLAIFFGTTVDELLDFDRARIDREVDEIVGRSVPLRAEPAKAEAFYREALKKYPNNEVLLNCLIMAIPDSRTKEKIEIGERLLEYSADDAIRLDVLRLLATACHNIGEENMARAYLERLPELYFLKTEVAAEILEGDERLDEIEKTENVCLSILGSMLRLRAAITGDEDRFHAAAERLDAAFSADPDLSRSAGLAMRAFSE